MVFPLKVLLDAIAGADFRITQAATQASFNTLQAVWRFKISHALLGDGPAISLADFEELAQSVIDRGLQLGALAYHVGGSSEIAASRLLPPVGFGELMAGLEALQDGGSRVASLHVATRSFPSLPRLFGSMVEGFYQPHLSEHREGAFLRAGFGEMITTGFKAEHLFPHLAAESEERTSAIGRIIEVLRETGVNDLDARLGAPASAHPWPRDLRCLCGTSLADAIYCCDPQTPIPARALPDNPSADHVLVRPCCGETFRGFRCDRCARLYTWQKGLLARSDR